MLRGGFSHVCLKELGRKELSNLFSEAYEILGPEVERLKDEGYVSRREPLPAEKASIASLILLSLGLLAASLKLDEGWLILAALSNLGPGSPLIARLTRLRLTDKGYMEAKAADNYIKSLIEDVNRKVNIDPCTALSILEDNLPWFLLGGSLKWFNSVIDKCKESRGIWRKPAYIHVVEPYYGLESETWIEAFRECINAIILAARTVKVSEEKSGAGAVGGAGGGGGGVRIILLRINEA